jgi:hypothetical protein
MLSSNEYRGRVMSMFVMLMGGTTPIGGFLLGAIAQAQGIHVGLVIFGSLVVIGIGTILVLDRRRPMAVIEPEPAPNR